MNIYLYKYYNDGKIKNAAGKAPNDIYEICKQLGWGAYGISNPKDEKSVFSLIKVHLKLRNQLKEIEKKKVDYILYQSPMFGSFYNKYILNRLSKNNAKIITLIHDIDGLRFFSSFNEKKKRRELKVFKCSDYIICHNEKMKSYLVDKGIEANKIVPLECFDYLSADSIDDKKIIRKSIAIAGNLNPIKCKYIYKMIEANQDLHIDLYGIGYESDNAYENVEYHGSFLPEELPEYVESMFGLVWDGDDIGSCVGEYGNYLKYNNPHKLSLYMAAGIPVVVWDQSAIADFVEKYNVGIKVSDLFHLQKQLNKVTDDQYSEMLVNVKAIQRKVLEGYFFKNAISDIMTRENEK